MDYSNIADKYNQLGEHQQIYRFGGTDYLVTRELPHILTKYTPKKVLDFGCGAGLSTRFVKSLGYECIGIDISQDMLRFAKLNDSSGVYIYRSPEKSLPFKNETFDMVVSIFVLFEISTTNLMIENFKELARILKKNGVFVAITGSAELYRRNWISLNASYPENINPKSGDICKIHLLDINLILNDYYWCSSDYSYVAESSGFEIVNSLYPLGKVSDGIEWKDELIYPPYVFYEFRKID